MTHWVILVGVLYHGQHRPADNNLKGCVADVEDIEEFLGLQIPVPTIFKLTSSLPLDGSHEPPEPGDERATARNFLSRLDHVIEYGKEGDNVYIHYSGHGSRSTDDVRLNFFTASKGAAQLPGSRLAGKLKEMVTQKMLVTVVFDCCFSAATKRHNKTSLIRYSEYSSSLDDSEASHSLLDEGGNLGTKFSLYRNAQALPEWIVDPKGYTIFCACTSSQEAKEITKIEEKVELDANESPREILLYDQPPASRRPLERGALSYLLLEALKQLKKAGTAIYDQSLHEHLRARFHARIPAQTPVLYGSKDTSFFASYISFPDTKIASVFLDNERWILRKGAAHGVRPGDQFVLFALKDSAVVAEKEQRQRQKRYTESGMDSQKGEESNEYDIIFMVKKVRGLTSELQATAERTSVSDVYQGWMARPLTQLPPQVFTAQLHTSDRSDDEWLRVSAELHYMQLSIGDPNVIDCLYNITLDANGHYEICDSLLQPIRAIPSVPSSQIDAKLRVVDILEHIATYKYIEDITNRMPEPSLANSFHAQFRHGNEGDTIKSAIIQVKEGEHFFFEFENRSNDMLYLYLYALGPDWSIEDQMTVFKGGEMVEAKPHDPVTIEFEAALPDYFHDLTIENGDEVFKVFVTRRPDSFASLKMRPLSSSPKRGALNRLQDFLASRKQKTPGEARRRAGRRMVH
ncbi:hypothetical protein N0V90_005002 [Kalmusia sp. IMI 367209]|nr:hypothetical protein N0V90_005002 [Kalmusia sp. IMI 367209]